MEKTNLSLNVAETYHDDIGKSIVRVDKEGLKKLSINSGDYVLLKAKSETLAKV